ncbi:hypothetical protein DVH02_22160 [Streptomyces corynorhini]|uniref:Uncharacterized protein n=1 Tax=Streptomyces corynorhini TaxID=2282652 RepID=A0A370B887_9ACTN|nr:hypothetical protein DVH02_22160 [Streptomyces corynorhini]
MAWDEWERLKADAADRKSAQMRLNQLPANAGGDTDVNGQMYLVVHDDHLGELGSMAYALRERIRVDGDHARPTAARSPRPSATVRYAWGGGRSRGADRSGAVRDRRAGRPAQRRLPRDLRERA